tara:strand:+ start:980 stop:1123 length:144 start_codon:yes stop_codon:yes gene_type:complete
LAVIGVVKGIVRRVVESMTWLNAPFIRIFDIFAQETNAENSANGNVG